MLPTWACSDDATLLDLLIQTFIRYYTHRPESHPEGPNQPTESAVYHYQKFALAAASALLPVMVVASTLAQQPADDPPRLEWSQLPTIPDPLGFGSPFSGVSQGQLILAGGSNFPGKPPWRGGTKVFYNSIFALAEPSGRWSNVGKLPRPIAGGVSVTTPRGIICVGGCDTTRCYADCFLLKLQNDAVVIDNVPPLPRPCANAAGVLMDGTIYVAGGIDQPTATAALKTFWSLNLDNFEAGWRELSPWPGPARMLATIGTANGCIYLFSGADLNPGKDGKPERVWLKDAYRFSPTSGWNRIADLPRVAVAVPTPAYQLTPEQLLIFGGDDGAQASLPPQSHSGFRRDVLCYNTTTDTWSTHGELPFALVTTPVVVWNHRLVIPGGEVRPAVRSTQVWAARIAE